MKTKKLVGYVALVGTVLFAGCTTRSISNSGYGGGGHYYYGNNGDPFYRGELNEFDLLGIVPKESISEDQIGKALDTSARVRLRKGSSVLLIQSGAMQPDKPMLDAMEKHFSVVPFTGQPGTTNSAGYARALRLAAAQAGCETMICYWGTLESASKGNEAKTVSWVPVAGWVLPDESQQMRIRLKLALVDVRSGHWAMCSSQTFDDRAHSTRINRGASDQKQVQKLKELGYASAAEDLVKIYAR
jgi:hypothetical protein